MWAGPPVVALRRVCGHIVGLPLSEEQAVLQPEGVKDSFPQVLSSQDSCVFCKREPQSAANTTRAKGGDFLIGWVGVQEFIADGLEILCDLWLLSSTHPVLVTFMLYLSCYRAHLAMSNSCQHFLSLGC